MTTTDLTTDAGLTQHTQSWPAFLQQAAASGQPLHSVWLTVVDPHGRLKGKRISQEYFDPAHPTEMCGYLMTSDGRNNPVTELSNGDTGYADMRVIPDFRSAALMPGEPGVAHVFGHAHGPDGAPLAIDPHAILARQLDRLAQLGLRAKIGLEAEFVLQHGTRESMQRLGHRPPRPVFTRNLDYSADAPPSVHAYLDAFARALSDSGHPVETLKCEGAPGQLEVTFRYGDPLQACWWHLRMQRLAMQLAEQKHMTANFMAAPQTNVGNGLHLHLSLWDKDDEPVFSETDPLEESSTSRLDQAVGGLLATLPALAPLYAPTPNSYRRYRKDSFAPTRFNYGLDNRTCAVRVVGEGAGRRLEIRVPGADAHPFLAVASAVAGIVHGLTKQVKPPTPIAASGYDDVAPHLPPTLPDAMDAFDSPAAREALGADVVEHYATLGRALVATHDQQVSDTDRRLWFERA
ncbi:glutamine synthetase family protein [Streptomyces sp. DT195]|uniref:glutamine synthetase family protein n=1 Tax=Streptomyces sp. DT195 TaxID=3393419 RepID=UPI003CED8179